MFLVSFSWFSQTYQFKVSLSIVRVDIYGDYSTTDYTVERFINQAADCNFRLSAGSYVEGLPLRVHVFHTVYIAVHNRVGGNVQSAIIKRERQGNQEQYYNFNFNKVF